MELEDGLIPTREGDTRPRHVRLTIVGLGGRATMEGVDVHSTVLSVRRRIEDECGIPVVAQKTLTVGRKRLEDEHTLAECDVSDHAYVQVVSWPVPTPLTDYTIDLTRDQRERASTVISAPLTAEEAEQLSTFRPLSVTSSSLSSASCPPSQHSVRATWSEVDVFDVSAFDDTDREAVEFCLQQTTLLTRIQPPAIAYVLTTVYRYCSLVLSLASQIAPSRSSNGTAISSVESACRLLHSSHKWMTKRLDEALKPSPQTPYKPKVTPHPRVATASPSAAWQRSGGRREERIDSGRDWRRSFCRK
jgi:hypothetical protein